MKRIISLLLSLLLAISLLPPALAVSDEATAAANALYELGLFNGVGTDESGNPIFDLDRAPTRHEAITMLVRLLGKADEAESGTWTTPFTDVAEWAKPYVGYAYTNGLAGGTSATTFSGNDTVSASQYLTFVLRALGYESGTDFQWDKAWELSDKIGLTDGRYNAGTTNVTRGDVAIISKNTLSPVLEAKAEILKVAKSGFEELANGYYLMADAFSAVIDMSPANYYARSYLKKEFQYVQEYMKRAVENFNSAINLCDRYPDTHAQAIKGYLTQLTDIYTPLMNYTITADNVNEYIQLFPDVSEQQSILDLISAEMHLWVDDAIISSN